jgi:hypothetical protein
MLTRYTFSGLLQSEVTRQRSYAVLLAQERTEDAVGNAARLAEWEQEMARVCTPEEATDLYGFPAGGEPGHWWKWAIEPLNDDSSLAELRVSVVWQPSRGRGQRASFTLGTRVLAPGYIPPESSEEAAPQ